MKLRAFVRLVGVLAVAYTASLFAPGCETNSADTVIRNLGFNFTGFYRRNDQGDPIPIRNSGAPVTSLDMRQTGDELEAVDNNGKIYRGRIGELFNGEGTFELTGETTAGKEVTMSGRLSSRDGGASTNTTSQVGTMRGTWIEPDFFSSFFAVAVIPGRIDTGGGGGDTNTTSVQISPSGTITLNAGSRNFSATGGSGN